MKNILFILAALFPFFAMGQSQDQNYIQTTIYRDVNSQKPKINIIYFDGLGRKLEQVEHQQSPLGNDIVTPFEYDDLGRQRKEYLPIITSPTLEYHGVTSSEVGSYYSTQSIPNLEATGYPFGDKEIENSPLNRVFKQTAPGDDWKLGGGHEIKFDYRANVDKEVRQFGVTTIWNSSCGLYDITLLDEMTYYKKNELYKNITKDENWTEGLNNSTEVFTDKLGRIVLKRTYSSYTNQNGTVIETEVAHDTYYVYDDFGNLTYVIPPLVKTSSSAVVSQDVLDNMCYQYKYDTRNRQVVKKMPGKQWEYIVFNKLNKPVATGPVKNPWGEDTWGWLITKYDDFNRIIYTGWLQSTVDFQQRFIFQEQLGSSWAEHFLDNNSLTIDGVPVSYSNDLYPTEFKLLTVNYYDTYAHAFQPQNIPSQVEGQDVLSNVKGLETGSWVRVLNTSSDTNGEASYSLYDKNSRKIRNHKTNYLGGYTIKDFKLDFTGKTLSMVTYHKRINSLADIKVRDFFEYTEQDRLMLHKQSINGGAMQLIVKNDYNEIGQLITKQVGGTDVTTFAGLQKVDYTYNIRGWLHTINNIDNLEEQGTPTDLFAFKINYNNVQNNFNNQIKSLYNGNIAETSWKTITDNILRKYSYCYDDLNRLNKALYQKQGTATGMYNEQIEYDKNGNIIHLSRFGDLDADQFGVGSFEIDDLTYTYDHDKKNQLMKVTDATNVTLGFKDDSSGTNDVEDDYSYDSNGNITVDQNKGITMPNYQPAISYNHLNLPVQINFVTGNKISYLYDALGQKVEKKVFYGSQSINTDYLDGYQYTNEILNFFPHKEGYVSVNGDPSDYKFYYVFNYLDHLGNIRVSYGLDPIDNVLKILEENHYYPFGLRHTNYNGGKKKYEPVNVEQESTQYKIQQILVGEYMPFKYKYNGKELQDELGLNMYDYGMMLYDRPGRRNNVDPLAEETPNWSPYAFCMGNPIKFNDPTGMAAEDPSTDVTKNTDGTYTVVGGKVDGDKNIYVVDQNGKRTGDVIGQSLTEYSFLDEKGSAVKGAVIDSNDTSGINFLNVEIVNNKDLTLIDYMKNATGGEKYDFKTQGIDDRPIGMSKDQYKYRGMLFQGVDGFSQGSNGGNTIFASARDFGNVGAGYVAGSNGLSWSEARTGFDSLQSYQQGKIATEGQPTQRAERAGFNAGAAQYRKEHSLQGSLRGNYPPK